jgi:hypothetical protein
MDAETKRIRSERKIASRVRDWISSFASFTDAFMIVILIYHDLTISILSILYYQRRIFGRIGLMWADLRDFASE